MNKDVKRFLKKLPGKHGKALTRDALLVRDWHAEMVLHIVAHDAEASAALAMRTFDRLATLTKYPAGKVPDDELAAVLDEIVRDMDATWDAVHAKLNEAADTTLPVH